MSRARKNRPPRKAAAPQGPGLLERHLASWDEPPPAPADPRPPRAARLRRAAALGAIVLCCLLTRLSAARTLDVDNDEAIYTTGVGLQYAAYIESGDVRSILGSRENYEHPPLVKLIHGAAIAATGMDRTPEQVVAVCRAVAVLFACLTAVLLFLLSPWAALVFSLHTWEIHYSSKGWLDSVTVFFLVAAFFFFVRARGRWNRSMAASAVFLGAGVAAKYVTGLFALTLLPFLLVLFRRRLRHLLLYVGISLLAFYVLDPAIWRDPIGSLWASLRFHQVESGTALYRRFLERYGGDPGPLGQLVSLWGNRARYQPDRFAFGLDRMFLVLGFLGLPFLFRRSVILFAWFASAALFLVLYPIKYPHYTMVFLPALALSAAEALRSAIPWLAARLPDVRARLRIPRLPREREAAALVAAAVALHAAVFTYHHWNDGYDSLPAHNSYADTLARLGRAEEARVIFARLGQGGGELAVAARLNLADRLLQEKRIAEARAELALVLAEQPDSAEGRILMGNSLRDEGRLDEALAEYRRADPRRLPDPNAVAALWVNIASIHMRKDELVRCREALARALQLAPRHGEAHHLLGLASFLEGDAARAERELRLAIEYGSGGWKVHHDLGVACAQQKRYREAIAAWEKALALDPGNAETRGYLDRVRGAGR